MKLLSLVQFIRQSLRCDLYSDDQQNVLSYVLLEHLVGEDRYEVICRPTKEVVVDRDVLQQAIEALNQSMPVEYITGKSVFYGHSFVVNPAVLIPRPETEELVRTIIDEAVGDGLRILDVCSGSGAIGISLALALKGSLVTGLEISPSAIEVARINKERLSATSVEEICCDVLSLTSFPERYDIIVSNPPYVMMCQRAEMQANVLDYEPHTALFVPDETPLIFYDKIGRLALEALVDGGKLYFEINEALGEQTVVLLEEMGYSNVQLQVDLMGKNRIVKAEKQSR